MLASSEKWPDLDLFSARAEALAFVEADIPLEWSDGRGFIVRESGTFTTRPVRCSESTLVLVDTESSATQVHVRRAGTPGLIFSGRGERISLPDCEADTTVDQQFTVAVDVAENRPVWLNIRVE